QVGFRSPVGSGLGEAAHVNWASRCQRFQYVVRTDLVAAVRWKWHPVGQEQDAAHPRPRAIIGPSRLASDSGSLRHTAILAACRSLWGSASRGGAPGAVQLA